jgi:hypothetical protein
MPAALREVVILSILMAGCSSPSTAPRTGGGAPTSPEEVRTSNEAFPPRAPFVAPGERMSYRLTMHGLEVATFTMAIGGLDELDGRQVVIVQSGVESSELVSRVKRVEDNFTSWIDASTSRPVLFRSAELATADDPTVEQTDSEAGMIVDGGFTVRVTRAGVDQSVDKQVVGELPLFDLNGFLIVLRSWEAPEGTRASADVIRSRFLWRTEVTMAGFENLVTELGELPALRIDGVSQRVGRDGQIDPKSDRRKYSLWISNDADRVPLAIVARTDYGDLRMDIVEYSAGTGARLGP